MNENAKMGFTYNVKHFSPKDELVEEFDVHNLIPDEGINIFLNLIFKLSTNTRSDWENTKASGNIFRLSLMTNYYTPHKTDTYSEMYQQAGYTTGSSKITPYGIFGTINSSSYFVPESRLIDFAINADQQGVTSKDVKYTDYGSIANYPTWTFDAAKLITGVCLISLYNTYIDDNYLDRAILSAALFSSPIQMEKNGKLTIKTGFTLISA